MSIAIFGVVVALWVAMGILMFGWGSSTQEIWQWLRSRPPIVQVPLWVLFLPWAFAMYIWESSMPYLIRLLMVAGIAWASVCVFLPWKPGDST